MATKCIVGIPIALTPDGKFPRLATRPWATASRNSLKNNWTKCLSEETTTFTPSESQLDETIVAWTQRTLAAQHREPGVADRRCRWPAGILAAGLSVLTAAGCGSLQTQPARQLHGPPWSYAHVMDLYSMDHRFDFDWSTPDPKLTAEGSPQVRCRVLDVAEQRCAAVARQQGQSDCQPTLTWVIQLQVLWSSATKPRYIGLGLDNEPDEKMFRYPLPARGLVERTPTRSRWREAQTWLARDRSERHAAPNRIENLRGWEPELAVWWLHRHVPVVVRAPVMERGQRPPSYGVLVIEERGPDARIEEGTMYVMVRFLRWLVDRGRPEIVETSHWQHLGCRLALP
ncbi:MAG: hypothetical protein H6747_13975 [Deltaproteobacteria bacterium]|nr:hypothetical protein [Deltaproteobacteria bacterium]